MKTSPNQLCPCDSERKHKKCCQPILKGVPAGSPEALMRSRYTAYKTGHVAHIIATTHAESPHFQNNPNQWAEDIQSFCDSTSFDRLEIQFARSEGDQGWVQFVAHLHQGGQAVPMQEHSEFLRNDGRWLYVREIEVV